MKTLANVGLVENPSQHHHINYNIFDQKQKAIQPSSFLITYKKNFLIRYQYGFGFYEDSQHKTQ